MAARIPVPQAVVSGRLTKMSGNPGWPYLVASLPFFVLWWGGREYGSIFWLLVPGLLCVAQFFHKSLVLWIPIAAMYCAASVGGLSLLLIDCYRVFFNKQAKYLVDTSDTLVFIVLVLAMFSMLGLLLHVRPRRRA